MSFLAYMARVANINYQLNYEHYQQVDSSFELYNTAITDCTNSRELATIETELLTYC